MIAKIAADRDNPSILGLVQDRSIAPVRSAAGNHHRELAVEIGRTAAIGARGVAHPDFDPLLLRLREAEALQPGGARRTAAGSIDDEVGRNHVLDAIADSGANALDRGFTIVGDQFPHHAVFDHAHIRQRHQATADIAFQHGAGSQQSDQIARRGLDGNAMTVPAHIAGNVAHDAAAGDDPAGPAGKEILDDGTAARQQAMRVAALRHALARNIQPRKRIAFQHRDDGVGIR